MNALHQSQMNMLRYLRNIKDTVQMIKPKENFFNDTFFNTTIFIYREREKERKREKTVQTSNRRNSMMITNQRKTKMTTIMINKQKICNRLDTKKSVCVCEYMHEKTFKRSQNHR